MDVIKLLKEAKRVAASDLHLVVASPPLVRIDGSLQPFNGKEPLTPTAVNDAFLQITTPEERQRFNKFLELDFSYTAAGLGHFRCNAAQQRGAISLSVRLLPPEVPTIEELELPQICKDLVLKQRGLIVVTGPTGSGKTTTLAAMINHLNLNERRHIVTIEDPIEYVHPSINCAITQRQLGRDTLSFDQALKHILRQDPDVIMVGEMRDYDTASAVLNVAETGHLVLSTSHAPTSHQAMERVIDLFPPHQRSLAQTRLASLLVGVLCQTLVPRANGSGRIAAVEVLLANAPVKNLLREGKIYQIPNVIRTHHSDGMISMDESLVNLYLKKIISGQALITYCHDRDEVEKMVGKISVEKPLKPRQTNILS